MRTVLEKWLTDIWYRKSDPPWLLRSLETVYKRVITDKRSMENGLDSVPIIVIGNITAGGTGKTPLVIALCKRLLDAGLNPGVISRGYGRKSKGLYIVQADDNARNCGDESLLIKQETSVPVILAENRRQAIVAMQNTSVNIIIADDGLQNKNLPRDLEICLIDGERQFGNGHLIPAGPLREPLEGLNKFDHILVNGDVNQLQDFLNNWSDLGHEPLASVMSMDLVASKLEPLDRYTAADNTVEDLSDWTGRKVYAIAGIGNPQRFEHTLKNLSMLPMLYSFPDHHEYSATDFHGLQDYPLLMTTKDAIKCVHLNLNNAWVLSVDAVVNESDWEKIVQNIERIMRERQEGVV